MQLRPKRFDRPDEIRTVEKARIELVELGKLAAGRAIRPGDLDDASISYPRGCARGSE